MCCASVKTRVLASCLCVMAGSASAQVSMSAKEAAEYARTTGRVKAVLVGDSASLMRDQMRRPEAVIYLEAWPIADLEEPGCKRIGLRFTSPGTALELKGGGTKDLDLEMGMNLCEGGRPPASLIGTPGAPPSGVPVMTQSSRK